MRQHGILFSVLSLVVVGMLAMGFFRQSQAQYASWQSLEPDLWASVWLIKTHIDPDSRISLLPPGSDTGMAVSFAVPDSDFRRDRRSSSFEKLLTLLDQETPDLDRMGALITSLESLSWSAMQDPLAAVVEAAYRRLQDRFDRDHVPTACYGEFFSAVYDGIVDQEQPDVMTLRLAEFLERAESACRWESVWSGGGVLDNRRSDVDVLALESVLNAIAEGKSVMFVDTRETDEFERGRIPGAVNLKLREVTPESAGLFAHADIVVSYCLKDFRGYEVARKLKEYGVAGSVTMTPHGLVGWHVMGLPTTDDDNDAAAIQALHDCANNMSDCIGEKML